VFSTTPVGVKKKHFLTTLTVMHHFQMLKLGAKCYSRAISLTNNMSSYWHSLGVNLFYQAREEDDSETASAFASRASAVSRLLSK